MSDLPNATGAGVTEQIGIETVEVSALDLKDLGMLERQALKSYKDHCVSSFVEMAGKYMAGDEARVAIREKIDQIAFMDVDAVPEKEVDHIGRGPGGAAVVTKIKVPYAAWWMQATFEGRLHMVWLSLRKNRPTMTLDECARMVTLSGGEKKLESLVKTVDEVSSPAILGSSPAPPQK